MLPIYSVLDLQHPYSLMHTNNALYLESRIITQSVRGLLQLNPSRGGPPQRTAPESLARKTKKPA